MAGTIFRDPCPPVMLEDIKQELTLTSQEQRDRKRGLNDATERRQWWISYWQTFANNINNNNLGQVPGFRKRGASQPSARLADRASAYHRRDGLDGPEVPDRSEVPVVPKAPGSPKIPDVPKVPGTPEDLEHPTRKPEERYDQAHAPHPRSGIWPKRHGHGLTVLYDLARLPILDDGSKTALTCRPARGHEIAELKKHNLRKPIEALPWKSLLVAKASQFPRIAGPYPGDSTFKKVHRAYKAAEKKSHKARLVYTTLEKNWQDAHTRVEQQALELDSNVATRQQASDEYVRRVDELLEKATEAYHYTEEAASGRIKMFRVGIYYAFEDNRGFRTHLLERQKADNEVEYWKSVIVYQEETKAQWLVKFSGNESANASSSS